MKLVSLILQVSNQPTKPQYTDNWAKMCEIKLKHKNEFIFLIIYKYFLIKKTFRIKVIHVEFKLEQT